MLLTIVVLEITLPQLLGRIIKMFNYEPDLSIMKLLLLILCLSVSLVFITYFKEKLTNRFRLEKIYDYYLDKIGMVLKSDYITVENSDKLYLNEQLISDSSNILTFIMSSVVPMFISIIQSVVVSYFFIFYNLDFMFILLAYCVGNALLFIYFKDKISKVTNSLLHSESAFYSRTTNDFNNIDYVISNSLNEEYLNNFILYNGEIKRDYYNFFATEASYEAFIKLYDVVFMFFLIVYFWITSSSRLDMIGDTVVYLGLFMVFSSSYAEVLSQLKLYASISESFKRMKDFDRKYTETEKVMRSSKHLLEVDCVAVKFSYENLKEFDYGSFKFIRGLNVIEGKNASGKTTLLKIIMKLYQTKSGMVRFKYESGDILKDHEIPLPIYIPQEPNAFETTIRVMKSKFSFPSTLSEEMGMTDVIQDCCRIAKMGGEKGCFLSLYAYVEKLSVGQKKKLIILAGLGDIEAGLIIIDEPENNMDFESINSFRAYMDNCSVFDNIFVLVSHGDYVFENANIIKIRGHNE